VLFLHQVITKTKQIFNYMRKIYLSMLALAAGVMAQAQTTVTFNVDMNAEIVSPMGVHIAGNFEDQNYDGTPENDAYVNWSPDSLSLSDDDLDGVYSISMDLMPARYEFKFINGNDWPQEEDVPSTCQVEVTGNSNRQIMVGADAMAFNVCFAQCAACGENAVRFSVDMSTQPAVNPVGVHVAGDFQNPNMDGKGSGDWTSNMSPLQDWDGNGVWEGVYSIGQMTSIEYKFINGNDWVNPNESVSGACSPGNGNRFADISETNTPLGVVCWNSCDPCTQPTMVTFRVGMVNEVVSPNGVHIAGDFQGWNPGDPAGELFDGDGDGVYEVTLPVAPGTINYKFVNGNAWDGADNSNESLPAGCNVGGNRQLLVEGVSIIAENCYNQCTVACVANPSPADITFRVNMSDADGNSIASPDGIFLISNFTNPQWQGGAMAMTNTSDNIYEVTVSVSGSAEFQYKFVNGNVDSPVAEDAAGVMDCGVENGVGGYNRVYVRSGEAEVLSVVCFNACTDCIVSVDETDFLAGLQVFPNPADQELSVRVNSANAQTLRLQLINSLGQVVENQNLGIVAGERVFSVDVAKLPVGIYNLSISNGLNIQNKVVSIK
jgi:Secretion system C-terminal sorting domain